MSTENQPNTPDNPPIGSVFYVSCSTGYTSSQWSGIFSTTCLNFGVWDPYPVDLSCQPVDCGAPPELVNLTLAASNASLSTTYLSRVSYECEAPGHLINGTSLTWEVSCSESGQWLTDEPPSCIPKICTPPAPVANSYLVPGPQGPLYLYGDFAVINCDPGSVFNGTYSSSFPMFCQMDGTWDAIPGVPCRGLGVSVAMRDYHCVNGWLCVVKHRYAASCGW
ncbi:sushi/von Willebrand factor type A/EGF/pentraxin domain-containing 1 [Elysia marginata]|uniref:Sushi/von Willebrand factor type A/EGF/pentraxin domain-containing 1 n=1 Tax=Elysia marginata TaxID=1093978 RepID=A0AAV4IDK0_9GAST|nr:sushi/von Willebrand factor type A/EGF/pentraxin domain-containing 1 [Elysia marginata]